MSDEEKLGTWTDSSTQAVCQRTLHQEKTMAKTGTLPHYLYSNKTSEVAETVKVYLADMVMSSIVEKEVPNMTDQHKVPKVETRKKSKQIKLTLQLKRRMICYQHQPVMLPAWTKGLFSWSVVHQDSADQPRLTQDSS